MNIFKRQSKAIQQTEKDGATETSPPKFLKPKVLLVDVTSKAYDMLMEKGYTVSAGTFGQPYKVTKSDDAVPVIINGHLPDDYTEHDIVIIDLSISDMLDQAVGEKPVSSGEYDWWASCKWGYVDPRPRFMQMVRSDFDRILQHKGVIVIFAEPRVTLDAVIAKVEFGTLEPV